MKAWNGTGSTSGISKGQTAASIYKGNQVPVKSGGSAIASKTSLAATPKTPVINANFRDPSRF